MKDEMDEVMAFAAEPAIPRSVSRLLVVGGSFDPPHRAHIDLPLLAARELQCEHVLFIPAARSPHKGEDPASPEHRLTMLRLALEAVGHASISRFELDRTPPSFTVETLRALKESAGDGCTLYLLMGSDQAISFWDWREPEEILRLATPAVMLRSPDTRETLDERARDWLVDLPLMEVSATMAREMLERGAQPGTDVLHPKVLAYINRHHLYRARA